MTRLLPGDSLTLDLAPEDPADLLARLRAAGVAMNESAERLITDARVCAAVPERVTVVERTLADLGLPDGSAHVLSPSLGDEPGVHRGLYLRVVDHVPRLHGFTCDGLHVFGPEDRWILAR